MKKIKKNKYNAQKTIVDGWTFDSKAEAKRYHELKLMQKNDEIQYFLCQVPFRLPGNIIYRVDFQIARHSWKCNKCQFVYFCDCMIYGNEYLDHVNEIIYEDVKGVLTDVSRIKIKQVQEIYGITINLITKKGVVNL